MEITQNNTAAALEAGAALSNVRQIGSTPVVIIPATFKTVDMEKMLPAPTRQRGTATLLEAGAFIDYVNALKGEATRLYCSVNPPSFLAVFNDDQPGKPNWRDHSAVYHCPLSSEWKAWSEASGKYMPQEAFAEFIHRNNLDCVNPAPAAMLEVSRELTAKKKVNFASSIRLQDGSNQFTYEEEVQGAMSKGQMKVPETFELAFPILQGGDPYKVVCDLRYRITDAKLFMAFEIVRPHKLLEAAFEDVRLAIADKVQLSPFHGSPAKS